MTLKQLRTAVRQRADQVHSQFVSDDELNGYVNESLYGLYDLLVTAYGADYYVTSASSTTDGTDTLALPTDFYKLLGVDLLADGSGRYVSLQPFNFQERNRASVDLAGPLYTKIRYRLRAGKLWLTPTPTSGQTVRVWYVPKLTPLVDPVFITVASVQADDSVEVAGYGSITAVASNPSTPDEFAIGSNDAETAANLAASLNELSADIAATAVGNVVSVTQEAAVNASFEWSSSNATRLAVSGGSDPTGPLYTGRNAPTAAETVSDGISGWLEYVVVDAAIKCMQKEESDTRVLERQRQGLEKRINDSAANRDAGSPATVVDTTRTGMWDDFDGPVGWGRGWD